MDTFPVGPGRWANVIVAPLFGPTFIGSAGEPDDYFHFGLMLVALRHVMVWKAWSWERSAASSQRNWRVALIDGNESTSARSGRRRWASPRRSEFPAVAETSTAPLRGQLLPWRPNRNVVILAVARLQTAPMAAMPDTIEADPLILSRWRADDVDDLLEAVQAELPRTPAMDGLGPESNSPPRSRRPLTWWGLGLFGGVHRLVGPSA